MVLYGSQLTAKEFLVPLILPSGVWECGETPGGLSAAGEDGAPQSHCFIQMTASILWPKYVICRAVRASPVMFEPIEIKLSRRNDSRNMQAARANR